MADVVPNRMPQRTTQIRWRFWGPVFVVFGLLMWFGIKSFHELNPTIEPKPELLEYSVTDEQKAKLSSKVLNLLKRIEARDVSGRFEREFAEVFSEADKVEESQNWRRYFFCLDGSSRELEGHPVIAVQVQKKTSRIIYCAITIPTW